MAAEHVADRGGLRLVAERRARAVRVDVADGVGCDRRIAQRRRHRLGRTGARVIRLRDVPGVPGGPVPLELPVDAGAASPGMLPLLEHDDPGAFGQHEAVTIRIEGPARPLRVVVAKRQGPHVLEARQRDGRERRLGAAGDHHLGVAVLDHPQGGTDRVGGARTGRRDGDVRALDTEERRDVAARGVEEQLRDEEGRHLVDTLVDHPGELCLELLQPADPRADGHAAAIGLLTVEGDARVRDGVLRGGDGELRIAVEPTQFLGVGDVLVFRLPGHLPAELHAVAGDVEERDRADAAVTPHEPIPEEIHLPAEGRDHAQPGDRHPPPHASPLLPCLRRSTAADHRR